MKKAGMNKETLTVSEALTFGMTLPYALIRSLSRVSLGPTPGEPPVLDELLEARFFDEKQEVRLFRRSGALCAVRIACDEDSLWIDKTYEIENKDLGGQVAVRHFLVFDKDGQCSISTSSLTGWKGRKEGQGNV